VQKTKPTMKKNHDEGLQPSEAPEPIKKKARTRTGELV